MIYMDYSATTPILPEVLDSYNKVSKEFIGNTNSLHGLGITANNLFMEATKQISSVLNISEKEVIYTSGATEANNMALKGIALAYQNRGKHIIVSKLEHPSIYAICDYLKTLGFEIDYVENDSDGLVSFEDLSRLVRKDTILVSIVSVNSELGIRQPLKTLRQIIKKQNTNTLFHSDMTQAIGKVTVNMSDVDLASISAHKFYGPKGIGMLYKNSKVNIVPLMHGSTKANDLRPGTIPLPLIVSMSKALRIAFEDLNKKEATVNKYNKKILESIESLEGMQVNQTKYSIPHILNVSIPKVKPETFVHALEEKEIYIGTNTACASGELSDSVMAVYNDKKRASSTLRISLSYLTTSNEVTKFMNTFLDVYENLIEIEEF